MVSTYSSLDTGDFTDVLATDVTFSDLTFDDELQGAADVEAFLGTWMSLPDFSQDPTFEISEDGSHLFEWGTWAASGPGGQFAVYTLAVHEISDGQITSMTNYYADPGVPEGVYQVVGPTPSWAHFGKDGRPRGLLDEPGVAPDRASAHLTDRVPCYEQPDR